MSAAIRIEPSGQEEVAVTLTAYLGDAFGRYRQACASAGARWVAARKCNVLPVEQVPELLAALKAAELEVSCAPSLATALQAQADEAAHLRDAGEARLAAADAALAATGRALYPFQRSGVRWLAPRRGALLADEPGLGKTIQALIALPEHAAALVVCPAAVLLSWRDEVRRWRPDLRVALVRASSEWRWPQAGEVVLSTYGCLPDATTGTLPAPEGCVLIMDEAHLVKGSKTKRTKAARALHSNVHEHGGRTWLLTGTPMLNRPPELWNVLGAAGLQEAAFGSWPKFCSLFHGRKGRFGYEWGHVSEDAPLALQRVSLHRTRAEVLPELPGKTRISREVNGLDAATLRACDAVTEMLAAKGIDLAELAPDTDIGKLIAGPVFELMSKARAMLATAKLPAALEIVESYEESDTPLVVASAHREPVDAIGERTGWATITGDTAPEERGRVCERFQTGELKGVALTYQAGGVGITLTRASHMLMVDLPWTPALISQCEDRLCVVEGQLVHTRRGIVTIDDVRVGDEVLSHTGRWNKVLATHRRQHRGLVTDILYSRYGDALSVTHEHPVLTAHGWKKAHEVLPGEYLVMPRPLAGEHLSHLEIPKALRLDNARCGRSGVTQINGRRRPMPSVVDVDDDLLFTFGFYLAEGFASITAGKGRFVSFAAHERERSLLERIGARLEKMGASWNIYGKKGHRGIELRAYSADLSRWFRWLFGHGAASKAIPPILMDLPIAQSRILLDAYIQGDGYARNSQREWVSVSSSLAHQMALLALRCGYAPTLRRRPLSQGGRYRPWVGCVTEGGRADNPALRRWTDTEVFQPVRRVTTHVADRAKERWSVVYDLQVEHDESFVVGMASVHNCRIGQKAEGLLYTRLVAAHPLDEHVTMLLGQKQALIEASVEASAVQADYTGSDPSTALAEAAATAAQMATEAAATPAIERQEEKRIERPEDLTTGGEARGKFRPAADNMELWAGRGLLVLAAMDPDHARAINAAGFSKFDGEVGHSLAESLQRYGRLSDKQWALAVRLSRKYRRQLGPEPEMGGAK